MEKREKYTGLYILAVIFIIISVIHILYATLSLRGLYEDGAMYAVKLLDNMANNNCELIFDAEHPRFIALLAMQFPVWILNIFHINGKNTLLTAYSFFQFAIPFLILALHYGITKRTGKTHVFFWHLLVYCLILLPFSIFSVVESYIGGGTHFILWNYLVSDMEYKKRDIFLILLMLVFMFGTYEYVIFLGILIFLFHFKYVFNSDSFKKQAVKVVIGLGALAAAIYDTVFMLKVPGESGEIDRFIGEAFNWLPHIFSLCSLYSVVAIACILLFSFRKTKLHPVYLIITSSIFAYCGYRLFTTSYASVYPMWEQHIRAIPCIAIPLIFIIMHFSDDTKNKMKYKNFICIVLMCGIMQTGHQIIDTYWWNKNVDYMKNVLAQYSGNIFIPSEHEEISSFHNEELRRFLWHGVYAATSIAFSPEYKQKTLLLSYDKIQDAGNPEGREYLYKIDENKISIPFNTKIDIKNKYWDLTDCADALDKYNKENNIPTYGNE